MVSSDFTDARTASPGSRFWSLDRITWSVQLALAGLATEALVTVQPTLTEVPAEPAGGAVTLLRTRSGEPRVMRTARTLLASVLPIWSVSAWSPALSATRIR